MKRPKKSTIDHELKKLSGNRKKERSDLIVAEYIDFEKDWDDKEDWEEEALEKWKSGEFDQSDDQDAEKSLEEVKSDTREMQGNFSGWIQEQEEDLHDWELYQEEEQICQEEPEPDVHEPQGNFSEWIQEQEEDLHDWELYKEEEQLFQEEPEPDVHEPQENYFEQIDGPEENLGQISKLDAKKASMDELQYEIPSSLKIFFSYSRKDSNRYKIHTIAHTLKTFPDIQRVFYYEGADYHDIIEYMNDNIEICDIFVAFCSKNASKSRYIKDEWKAAYSENKIIIPVFSDFKDVPALLKSYLGVEFDKSNIKGSIHEIYNVISKAKSQF